MADSPSNVQALIDADGEISIDSVRSIIDRERKGRLLAFTAETDFAFAAVRIAADVQRSIVILRSTIRVAVLYDISPANTGWRMVTTNKPSVTDVSSLDLAGAAVDDWVVLFHTEPRSATSALSFLVEGEQKLKVLVTGLAPGVWEIWRNGWLLDLPGNVTPDAGSLFFQERAGSYFLRRRG